MAEQFDTSGLTEAAINANRMAEQFDTSGMTEAAVNANRMAEQLDTSGMAEAIANANQMAEQFNTSGLAEAIANANQMAEQFDTSGLAEATINANRMAEQFDTSGLAEATINANQMAEQFDTSGMAKAAINANQMAEQLNTGAVAAAALSTDRLVEQFSTTLSAATAAHAMASQVQGLSEIIPSVIQATAAYEPAGGALLNDINGSNSSNETATELHTFGESSSWIQAPTTSISTLIAGLIIQSAADKKEWNGLSQSQQEFTIYGIALIIMMCAPQEVRGIIAGTIALGGIGKKLIE